MSLALSETPEDRFYPDEAKIQCEVIPFLLQLSG